MACFAKNRPKMTKIAQNNHFLEALPTGITTQYFLLIFDMLIEVNQKYLLAPFPVSTFFFFQNGLHNKNLLKAPTFTQISPYQGKCNTTT